MKKNIIIALLSIVLFTGISVYISKNNKTKTSLCGCLYSISLDQKSLDEIKEFQEKITLCASKRLQKRFKELQDICNIHPKIELFELKRKTFSDFTNGSIAVAFYNPNIQTVTIIKDIFKTFSPTVQDFFLYHELRHHLQYTTTEAWLMVQKYQKLHNLTQEQAMEYDADTFALQQIAKENCPHCIREIKDVRVAPFKKYTDKGYLTTKGIDPFLKETKKNRSICDYHKNKSKTILAFKTITSALKGNGIIA